MAASSYPAGSPSSAPATRANGVSPEVSLEGVECWLFGRSLTPFTGVALRPIDEQRRAHAQNAQAALASALAATYEVEKTRAAPRLLAEQLDRAKQVEQRAWKASELSELLLRGLDLRVDGYVYEFGGVSVYAMLRNRVMVRAARVRVCERCAWVWRPKRKARGVKLCERCHDKATPPPRGSQPVFGEDGSRVGYEQIATATCSCGRLFLRVGGPVGGRPRTRCRTCTGPRQIYEYEAKNGAPLVGVTIRRPDGTMFQPAVVNGIVCTDDAEDAFLLDRNTELRRRK